MIAKIREDEVCGPDMGRERKTYSKGRLWDLNLFSYMNKTSDLIM